MSTRYTGEDGRDRIKLSDEEALEMYNNGVLPLTPEQLQRLKDRLRAALEEKLK